MTLRTNPENPSAGGAPRDREVIALVGLAHGTSHFFHLMLPTLFPWLMRDFSLSFTDVGLLTTTFFVISGIGQALAGFVVDRVGGWRVLCFGVGMLAVSGVVLGFANELSLVVVECDIRRYRQQHLPSLGFHTPQSARDSAAIGTRVFDPRLSRATSGGRLRRSSWPASPARSVGTSRDSARRRLVRWSSPHSCLRRRALVDTEGLVTSRRRDRRRGPSVRTVRVPGLRGGVAVVRLLPLDDDGVRHSAELRSGNPESRLRRVAHRREQRAHGVPRRQRHRNAGGRFSEGSCRSNGGAGARIRCGDGRRARVGARCHEPLYGR